ncbi:MAG TPA: hypothetical protein IAB27_05205 [Candidatus Coprosoma intestinipullorum]|uniref:DUF3168 domain-containing protein n=1 Tax=Candidatus Coprosoma intestinipullorum TaxID=2840752 RepID=A0A9D0ZR62_9FIRM|nr:hypothetical protein [Candidatus Coprosoma intestinipullorum]
MIHELTEEEFTRIVENSVEELGYNTLLTNPDTNAKYPCITVGNTLSSILITEDKVPVKTRFQISIEVWSTSKYETMAIMDKVAIKLRDLNLTKVGTPTELYDEITSKHRRGYSFEVFFNGLTNSFDRTK